MEKNKILSFKEIWYNYTLLSDVTHIISKSPSKSKKENYVKFQCFNKIEKNKRIYAISLQSFIFGSFMYYCLKGKKPMNKFIIGLLYSGNFSFIYNYGFHLGILFSWNNVVSKYQNLENTETQFLINNVIDNIKDINNIRSESEILDDLLNKLNPSQTKKNIDKYIKNNYFSENYEKYQIGKENNFQIFIDPSDKYEQKIPYAPEFFNIFFIKIIYFSFTRYLHRFSVYLGIKGEEEF